MTRQEARALIVHLVRGEEELLRTKHFMAEMAQEGYIMHDVRAILRTHVMVTRPTWDEGHENFKVELRGRCVSFGRMTKLVLGLRPDGRCVGITIHELK